MIRLLQRKLATRRLSLAVPPEVATPILYVAGTKAARDEVRAIVELLVPGDANVLASWLLAAAPDHAVGRTIFVSPELRRWAASGRSPFEHPLAPARAKRAVEEVTTPFPLKPPQTPHLATSKPVHVLGPVLELGKDFVGSSTLVLGDHKASLSERGELLEELRSKLALSIFQLHADSAVGRLELVGTGKARMEAHSILRTIVGKDE
eukprot:CAMPEP_0119431990 /NCGR_PEP_ID=MMETSP1335-20130426/46980_1 /TAXON_ID=259385 /ORGANISM="Chrysoculter rhomboideus, Strain RCC1486" /LENGTH=206 /DNA_ID=CAMNT_0007457801 /DNA_START=16 /DNA_END=633 /DNA_ORIENTATION=-